MSSFKMLPFIFKNITSVNKKNIDLNLFKISYQKMKSQKANLALKNRKKFSEMKLESNVCHYDINVEG